jgi:hypothetical protein
VKLRALLFDAHEAINRSLNARTRRLQLKHGRRAQQLLNDAFALAPREPLIPESSAHPEPAQRTS